MRVKGLVAVMEMLMEAAMAPAPMEARRLPALLTVAATVLVAMGLMLQAANEKVPSTP